MDITLQHISKSYGGKPVIRDVSLTIRGGSFTTLLGPSGCGKTTLLRMIAGLETPDAGRIFLGSRCVFSGEERCFVPPEARGLGFVFQDFALWPHMTVFENTAFGLRASGRTEHLAERVRQALSIVHLEELTDRYPHQLSGGQQQRVAFARAVVTEPECILFDEPLSALDAQLRAEMRVELRELVTRLGLTAVFVTHDQSEAISMSDRIAVFSAGRLEQYDAPEAVYSHPATSFAAHFVGLSNWIDSRHFFRPEKASLSPAPGARIFTAGVVSSQYLGAGYEVHLLCGGERWTILSPVRAAPGASLTVSVRPEDIITV